MSGRITNKLLNGGDSVDAGERGENEDGVSGELVNPQGGRARDMEMEMEEGHDSDDIDSIEEESYEYRDSADESEEDGDSESEEEESDSEDDDSVDTGYSDDSSVSTIGSDDDDDPLDPAKATERMIRYFFIAAELVEERLREIRQIDAELEEMDEDDPKVAELLERRKVVVEDCPGTSVLVLMEKYPEVEGMPRSPARLLILAASEDNAEKVIRMLITNYLDGLDEQSLRTVVNEAEERQREDRALSQQDGSEGSASNDEGESSSSSSSMEVMATRPQVTYCTNYDDAMAFISQSMSLGASFVPATAAAA